VNAASSAGTRSLWTRCRSARSRPAASSRSSVSGRISSRAKVVRLKEIGSRLCASTRWFPRPVPDRQH